MAGIEEIRQPVGKEIKAFESEFRNLIRSKVFLLDTITGYIVKSKGKQIRPLFVFLSALACGGITEASHRGAGLIELLHTATLVHDDVVDDSNYRRGFFSINALWKNKVAVLVGDFLLSKGLLLSVDNGDFDLLKIVAEAVREMSEGELLQMEKARNLDITEHLYFEVIRKKTASLIAACCAVGASSAKASPEVVGKMKMIGEKVGMAFQIKDDLFDYGEAEIGKPLGIDIREKKLTLPLIHAIGKSSWTEKRQVISWVRNAEKESANIKKVIEFVRRAGGIDHAVTVMKGYQDEAQRLLNEMPASTYRNSLGLMIDYTISRSK